jgi:hypothetical protein
MSPKTENRIRKTRKLSFLSQTSFVEHVSTHRSIVAVNLEEYPSELLLLMVTSDGVSAFFKYITKIRQTRIQLGQSNGSITDGPAVCDNHPFTTSQQTRPSYHEFGIGNDWAEILNRPCTMGGPQEKEPHIQWVGPLQQGFMASIHCAHWSLCTLCC